MSVFKSQFSRALAVIKSDSADVPFPATNASGTNTSVSVSSLIDSAATFETNNVKTFIKQVLRHQTVIPDVTYTLEEQVM
jgi:hypothetical protein